MADFTSRLRLVVDSSGIDRSKRKMRDLQNDARRLRQTLLGVAGAFASAFSVREIIKVADQYRGIQNQLRLVTNGARELESAQKAVLQVANETGASLESTVRLYTNLERFAGEFLKTQQDTLDLTRAINQTAVISGASVTEAGNAVRQLSQAIAGGVLRAEEFNSIVENMPRLAEAIASGLGVGMGELRRQVNDGLVTSQALITSLQSQFGALNQEFLNSAKTIGQAMQAVGNIITVELGERLQGAQQIAIDALQWIGANFEMLIPAIEGVAAAVAVLAASFAFSGAVAAIGALISPLGLLVAAVGAVVAFRDDIAQWAFGVRDAGAVVSASIEVLGPHFTRLKNSIMDFVNAALPAIADFARKVVELFQIIGASISGLLGVMSEAINRVEIAAATKRLEHLAEQQRNLTNELQSLHAAPIISPGAELGIEILEDQLNHVTDQIHVARGELQKLLDPTEAAGINKVFKELGDQGSGLYSEVVTKAREKVAETHDEVTDSVVRTNREITKSVSLTKEEQNAAKKLKELRQDIADQQEIVNAARLGEHQERIAREVLNIRRQIAGISVEEARALAEQNVYLEEQLEIIREQRAIIEAPFEGLADNLRDAILNGGKAGVDGLKGVFKAFISDLKTAFLDSLFNPLFQAIRNIPNGLSVPIFGPQAGIGAAGVASRSLGGAQGSGGFSLPFLNASITQAVGLGLAGFFGSNAVLDSIGVRDNAARKAGTAAGALFGFLPALGLGAIASLFGGKPSDKVGQAVFDPATGRIVGTGQKDNSSASLQNLEIAKAISSGVSDAVKALSDIIGAEASKFINVAAGSRDGIRIGFQGAQGQIVNAQRFENTEAGAQAAVDAGIRLALESLKGGNKVLLETAKALASAGKPIEEIADTLSSVSALIGDTDDNLSEWQRRIKEINDTFSDAIESVKGITAAERELKKARDAALKSVTTDFNKTIQDDIAQYLNGPTDQLDRLLKAQKERFDEAKKLGADLSQVERLSALELRSFFDGLSDSALQEVQSFLGLFEEASSTVARNLDLSRQDLQSQRNAFQGFAETFAQLNTDFTERFVAASPRESLAILRGRANELLGQIGLGNESAAQALPQVLNQLVENARQSFGNTREFSAVLSFAQDIAKQAEDASLNVVSEAERQIAALDQNNDLLGEIRDILASSQAANAFFQSYASGGIATSDELLNLIQQGAGLNFAANDNAAALNVTGLIAQSVQPIVAPLATSIDAFTQRLADMPDLMRLQIESTENVAEQIREVGDELVDVLERLEQLGKKQLAELEEAA